MSGDHIQVLDVTCIDLCTRSSQDDGYVCQQPSALVGVRNKFLEKSVSCIAVYTWYNNYIVLPVRTRTPCLWYTRYSTVPVGSDTRISGAGGGCTCGARGWRRRCDALLDFVQSRRKMIDRKCIDISCISVCCRNIFLYLQV